MSNIKSIIKSIIMKRALYIEILLYIVRILGPRVYHMFVFRACGPIRGRGVVQGGEIFIRKGCTSKYRLVLIIIAQESGPRINASLADPCRGL